MIFRELFNQNDPYSYKRTAVVCVLCFLISLLAHAATNFKIDLLHSFPFIWVVFVPALIFGVPTIFQLSKNEELWKWSPVTISAAILIPMVLIYLSSYQNEDLILISKGMPGTDGVIYWQSSKGDSKRIISEAEFKLVHLAQSRLILSIPIVFTMTSAFVYAARYLHPRLSSQ